MTLASHFYRPSSRMRKNRAQLLTTAHSYLGYRSQSSIFSTFGNATGYGSHPWAGSFVDVCFHEAGVPIPSVVYPPTGLAEFIRTGRFYPGSTRPQLGDIVFLSVPAGVNQMFSMPGIGIVTDLSRYKSTGQVGTIEGQIIAQDSSTITTEGVYRRIRSFHAIIGYGRPDYSVIISTEEPDTTDWARVHFDRLGFMRRNSDVGVVQRALSRLVGLRKSTTVDLYDSSTRDAYSHFQRLLGYNGADDVTGLPDRRSLVELGKRSRLFVVQADDA